MNTTPEGLAGRVPRKQVVCVTGASGLVGSRIAARLVDRGCTVRVLSRSWSGRGTGVEVFQGDLFDGAVVPRFLDGASAVFHAAAEVTDRVKMWRTNVDGTEVLLRHAVKAAVEHFCSISSIGVIGAVDVDLANEETPCRPTTDYERSKWAAEQLVTQATHIPRVVCLRPTNVVAKARPGGVGIAAGRGWRSAVKTLIQGQECVHVLHVENVAAAALHTFMRHETPAPTYVVSADHEPMNTLVGLRRLSEAVRSGRSVDECGAAYALPGWVPRTVRRVRRPLARPGPARYSSARLLATGFVFPYSLEMTVRDVIGTGLDPSAPQKPRQC
jgi:nucleoside-diphosphate-sugar epimerase